MEDKQKLPLDADKDKDYFEYSAPATDVAYDGFFPGVPDETEYPPMHNDLFNGPTPEKKKDGPCEDCDGKN